MHRHVPVRAIPHLPIPCFYKFKMLTSGVVTCTPAPLPTPPLRGTLLGDRFAHIVEGSSNPSNYANLSSLNAAKGH